MNASEEELLARVSDYLELHGLHYHEEGETRDILVVTVPSRFGNVDYAFWVLTGQVLRLDLVLFLPLEVPEPRRAALHEAIARINALQRSGSFEMDSDHGSLDFIVRTSAVHGTVTEEQWRRMWTVATAAVDRYMGALKDLIDDPDLDLEAAISRADTEAAQNNFGPKVPTPNNMLLAPQRLPRLR